MKDFAKKYIEKYESFDKWIKVVLCILWDVPSNLYRFSKSAQKDSMLGMILAVVLGIFGGWVLFVVDILCLVLQNKIYWLDDLGFDGASSDADVDDQTATAEVKDEKKD